jgi:nucleoside-diphosphate-sugar epimerase
LNVAHCLVTGGAGFIGSHLIDALLATGQQVRVLDDLSTGNLANLPLDRVELMRGSVADPDAVQKAVAGCEVVYHLAAVLMKSARPARCASSMRHESWAFVESFTLPAPVPMAISRAIRGAKTTR